MYNKIIYFTAALGLLGMCENTWAKPGECIRCNFKVWIKDSAGGQGYMSGNIYNLKNTAPGWNPEYNPNDPPQKNCNDYVLRKVKAASHTLVENDPAHPNQINVALGPPGPNEGCPQP